MLAGRLLLSTFACLCLVFFEASACRAAGSPKSKLFCPAAWPESPSARLTKVNFTEASDHFSPLDFYQDPMPYGADPGDELFCAYANGRSLLITIPGKPDMCFDVTDRRTARGLQMTDAYCTFAKTGDPAKDAIRIRETEPLTRATSIHGVRLGMTHDEVAAAITAKTAPVRGNMHDIYVLANTQQLVVNYNDVDDKGTVDIVELKPAVGHADGIVDEMRERFGFPDVNGEPDDPTVWRGQDGVRLAVYTNRLFGSLSLRDEYAFLIDGRKIADLDKQLKLDDGD